MRFSAVSIGILFNALVSAVVAGVACSLVIFLRRRWPRLDSTRRAYSWFWWFTVLVWVPNAWRYLLIGSGHVGPAVHYLDVLVQAGVFFSGPPLLAYLVLRTFRRPRLADAAAACSFGLGLVALGIILPPGGLPIREVTEFSAESAVNPTALGIFNLQATAILLLLLYDVARGYRRWGREPHLTGRYETLYSTAAAVYLALGILDQSGIVQNWPLVVIRLLYVAAFLFVYLIVTQEEASRWPYLVEESRGNRDSG